MHRQAPITDSPWFWFALFSAVGLSALLATGGKFGNRQAQIERKSQARAAVGDGLTITQDGTGRKTATKVPEYSRPGMTKIRLKPMAITIGLILAVSLTMLAREQLSAKNSLPQNELHDGATESTE
ncbi:MAG: hypothetical protein AAGD11_04865 [Planctomycetota bacterium]